MKDKITVIFNFVVSLVHLANANFVKIVNDSINLHILNTF